MLDKRGFISFKSSEEELERQQHLFWKGGELTAEVGFCFNKMEKKKEKMLNARFPPVASM